MDEERTTAAPKASFLVLIEVLFGSGGGTAWARFSAFVFTVACAGFAAGQWGLSGRVSDLNDRVEVVEERYGLASEDVARRMQDFTNRLARMERELCIVIGESTPQECARR